MNRCDIKFMAVPSRLGNVIKCLRQLGLKNEDVALDERYEKKPLKTWLRALRLPHEEGITHRVILQDDLEVGDRFVENIDFLCNRYPDNVFSLFITGDKKKLYEKGQKVIVRTGGGISGLATLIPLKYVDDIERILLTVDPSWQHDDIFLQYCCHKLDIKVLTTVPCFVENLAKGKENSIMEHGWGSSDDYRYDREADIRDYVPMTNVSMCIPRSYSIDKYIKV